jgi:hypothetical protein
MLGDADVTGPCTATTAPALVTVGAKVLFSYDMSGDVVWSTSCSGVVVV